MAKIYPHYHQPEHHPDFNRRLIRATTRDTLENTIQFMSIRDLPHTEDGTLLEIEPGLDMYTRRFDLGKVFWMRANLVSAPNLKDFLLAAKARGGFVFDLWGFVPGSYKAGVDWGEYTVTDAQHQAFTSILGDRFIGYDNGEQDGRYIGPYTATQNPAIQEEAFQQRRFYEFFDEMGQQLKHATTALCSLNFVHFFARENNCFMIGAETAQALPNANLWYAYIRGAGKQYGLLWFGNASVYNRFSWKSYDMESVKVDQEGYTYGPESGTSLSLLRRLLYVEYLYNSDILGYESGLLTTTGCMEKVNAGMALEPNKTTSDKSLFTGADACLSPIGQLQADCIQFVKRCGYAGVMATPVAFLLSPHSGWTMPRHLYSRQVYRRWGQMPYTAGDHQLHALYTMMYPGYEDAGYFLNERGFLTPTPYGDMADVLMMDAREETLQQYSLAVLAGDHRLDQAQADKLAAFLRAGGTAVAFARQVADCPAAMALFGLSALGQPETIQDAQVTCGQVSCREQALIHYPGATLLPAVEVLYAVIQGEGSARREIPFIIRRRMGSGTAILVLSPFGMDETRNPASVRNLENISIPQTYGLLKSVQQLLAELYQAEQLVQVDNPALQTVVNHRSDGVLTVTVVNNGFSTEKYTITLTCGQEVSRREIALPDLPTDTRGYWPLYTYPHGWDGAPPAPDTTLLAPGQMAMWEVTYTPTRLTLLPEIPLIDHRRGVYVTLRPKGVLIEALQQLPVLHHYFDGVKLDATLVSDMSIQQARQCGSYLRRRGMDVLVDFANLLDHYPHLSLIRNMPARQDAKLQWAADILDRCQALHASTILLNHHRNAENHLTPEEGIAHMQRTIRHMAQMAAERGIQVTITNGIPRAIGAQVADVRASYPETPYGIKAAHCLLMGDQPTPADVAEADMLFLSAPLMDDYGQLINAALPLHDSPMAEDVLARLGTIPPGANVCLDAVYPDFDAMYRDYLWLKEKRGEGPAS